MKIKKFVMEKKATITAFIPAFLLILLFILSKIGIITDEFTTSLIQLISIIIALLIPFITKGSEERKESEKLKKIHQNIFNVLTELCKLCIERGDKKIRQKDLEIFHLSRKLKKYSNSLSDLNISYTEKLIIIGNGLEILLNMDEKEGIVWNVDMYLIRYSKEIKAKRLLRFHIYQILEDIRKKHNLRWDKDIQDYFSKRIEFKKASKSKKA